MNLSHPTPVANLPDSRYSSLLFLENNSGCRVGITGYGARITSIVTPDRNGTPDEIALGFPTAEHYLDDTSYMGATVGPVANRISGAQFPLGNKIFRLDANDGKNTNHGGSAGLDRRYFDLLSADSGRIVLQTLLRDGEGGFPGNIRITVTYTLSAHDNTLRIDHHAVSDRRCVLNLTNHTYFNLSGCREQATTSWLRIASSQILESDNEYIPSGKRVSTTDTQYDFSNFRQIHHSDQPSDKQAYNEYYILNPDIPSSLNPAAELACTRTGRLLKLYTSYPGLMFYTGDFLSIRQTGIHGRPYRPCDGICLEAQLYPDAVNRPEFPPIVLDPEEEYRQYIIFKFSTF